MFNKIKLFVVENKSALLEKAIVFGGALVGIAIAMVVESKTGKTFDIENAVGIIKDITE